MPHASDDPAESDDRFRDDDWPPPAPMRPSPRLDRVAAAKAFERARRADLAGRRSDALHLYAVGLRLDPTDEVIYRRLFETALRRFRDGDAAAPAAQVERFNGPHPLDRFIAATLAWAFHLDAPEPALDALEAAAEAGLERFGQWHAPHVFLALWQAGSRDREVWQRAEEACAAVQAWDWVVRIVDVMSALDE